MNIVMRALRYEGFRLNLANEKILNCLLGLCSSSEDFHNLKMISFDPREKKKIDQAEDDFMLKYVEEELPKCKTLADFKNLSDQIGQTSIKSNKKVYQAWDNFIRANVNIEAEILKCQTIEDFKNLSDQVSINSKFREKVEQAHNKFILEYADQEILKCKTLEDFKKLFGQCFSVLEARNRIEQASDIFTLQHIKEKMFQYKTIANFKELFINNFYVKNKDNENKFFQIWDEFIEEEISRCKTPEDFENLYNKVRPDSATEKKFFQAWDNFMFKYIEEELPKCAMPKDFENLSHKSRCCSEPREKVEQAWDNFMLNYVEEQIPKCKTLKDFIKLRDEARYGSRAQDKVNAGRENFFEQALPRFSNSEEFMEACHIFQGKPEIVVKIIEAWSKLGQEKIVLK